MYGNNFIEIYKMIINKILCSTKNYVAEACKKIGTDFADVNSDAERTALWNMISKFNFLQKYNFVSF